MYIFMYLKMRNKGILRNLIFNIWYFFEDIKCNGIDILNDYMILKRGK
jgi:hypothetical protein